MDIHEVSINRSCASILRTSCLPGRWGIKSLIFMTLCVFSLTGQVSANNPTPIYLESGGTQQIDSAVMLHAMPGADYGNSSITLGNQGRIESVSASIAQRATFTLPDREYGYEFNTRTGRVDISANGSVILSLPVNAQGETTQVCLARATPACSKIRVDANLAILQNTLPGGAPQSQPRMRFNVAGGISALVTDSVATMQPSQRVNELPVLYFSAEEGLAQPSRILPNKMEVESATTTLFVVEPSGRLRPALVSDLNISVLYTLMSQDGNYLYVALDPGYDQNGELLRGRGNADTRTLIASENCALFRVSMQDNEYRCVDEGYLPVPLTDGFRQSVGDGLRKPLQLDDAGNLYYLVREFQLAQEGVFSINDVLPGVQLRRSSAVEGELRHLSMDTNVVDHFSVLMDGAVAYTRSDTNTLYLAFPAIEDGTIRQQALTPPRGTHLDPVFYTVDQSGTVLFGASGTSDERQAGIQFAQRTPDTQNIKYQRLRTELFAEKGGQLAPTRILLGDDYYVYGLFKQANDKLQLSQVLPYREDPLFVFDDPNALIDRNMFQVSKGHLYFVQGEGGFGNYYDTITIRRLADGREYKLLADGGYEIFNWRMSGDILTFAAFDMSRSEVVIGKIDTLEVRRTGRQPRIVWQRLGSAMGADAKIRDIEILLPQIPEYDYGGNPYVREVYTHPNNLYSVSVEFTKHMDIESVNTHLQVYEVNGLPDGGQRQFSATNGVPVDSMKIWLHRMVHLIIDRDPANPDTVPLKEATEYKVGFPAFELWDRYDWQISQALNHTFRTVGPAEYTVTAETTEGGSIVPDDVQRVIEGTVVSFTVTAHSGYQLDYVTGCDGTLTSDTYTTAPVSQSCTVIASFDRVADPYHVTVSVVNDGGGVSPQDSFVNHGERATFRIMPDPTYLIDEVSGCGGTLNPNDSTYTTGAVTESCEITVAFKREPIVIRSCDSWVASSSGGYGVTVDPWDISNIAPGVVFDIKYNAYGIPDKFIVQYPEGEEVLNTGWRGNTSYNGDPLFPGGIAGPGRGEMDGIFVRGNANSFTVTVEGPRNGTIWDYEIRCRVPANGSQD